MCVGNTPGISIAMLVFGGGNLSDASIPSCAVVEKENAADLSPQPQVNRKAKGSCSACPKDHRGIPHK